MDGSGVDSQLSEEIKRRQEILQASNMGLATCTRVNALLQNTYVVITLPGRTGKVGYVRPDSARLSYIVVYFRGGETPVSVPWYTDFQLNLADTIEEYQLGTKFKLI